MKASSKVSRIWPAPAKINLFLHVTGQRTDGYHELQTLFQILDWGDDVLVEISSDAVISRPRASYPVAEEDDLVVKAARLLQKETGCRQGATIEVIKRVPAGAGLGGGSSDAATVLLVLNKLWNCKLTIDELVLLGRQLGADVPVFIRGDSALATGVGDVLEPFTLGDRHYLLVFPDFPVSTSEVFSDAELPRDSATLKPDQIFSGMGDNDCEKVVSRRFPAFKKLLQELRKLGEARMTGTGSTIFLEMPDKKSAKSTAQVLKCRYNVRAVRGVDRSPLHEMLDAID